MNEDKQRKKVKVTNTLSVWLVFALGLSYSVSMKGVTLFGRVLFMAITIFMVSIVVTMVNDSVDLKEADKK